MEMVELNVLAFLLLILGLGSSFVQHKANMRNQAKILVKYKEEQKKKDIA